MKNRKTPFGTVLLWIAVGLAFVTVIGLFASLGNGGGDSGGEVVTTALITTATPITTAPTSTAPPVTSTEPPVTTAPPVTTVPPVIEEPITSGTVHPHEISTANEVSASYFNGDVFYLSNGQYNGVILPIEVTEAGLYTISIQAEEAYAFSSAEFFMMYIRESLGTGGVDKFVSKSCDMSGSYSITLSLLKGLNEVFLWTDSGIFDIRSISFEKIADYTVKVDSFTASGEGATTQYSKMAELRYTGNGLGTIESEEFTITEGGVYDLSFLGCSTEKVCVTILEANGAIVHEKLYDRRWNDEGIVTPDYNRYTAIYIPPYSFELAEGTYRISLTIHPYSLSSGDALAVHSAYLNKQ